MPTTRTDSLIAEIRAVRDEYAARFDYDVAAMFRDLRARQDVSKQVYVHRPARAVAVRPGVGSSAGLRDKTGNP